MTEATDALIKENALLRDRLAQLEAGDTPNAATMTPTRTPDNRYMPSEALAYALIEISEQAQYSDDLAEDEHEIEQAPVSEVAAHARTIIGQTLDRAIAVEASIAASEGRALSIIAETSGRFVDRVASSVTQNLGLNPYDAPAFLRTLQVEFSGVLQVGPITYAWGEVHAADKSIVITIKETPTATRSGPRSTFYRNIDDIR